VELDEVLGRRVAFEVSFFVKENVVVGHGFLRCYILIKLY
jgi:hypothetical protein